MTRSLLLLRLLGSVTVLALLLMAALLFALRSGTVPQPLSTVFQVLTDPAARESDAGTIIYQIRLPRALLAMAVGAALSLAGVAFQGLLRNPLADPYIVGTSAGAALGASLAVVLSRYLGTPFSKPVFAFVTALLTMYVVYRLAVVAGRLPVDTFLLAGVVVGSFLWAFVSFLLTVSRERMQEVVFWLMGDLEQARLEQVWAVSPYLLVGGVGLLLLSHGLNLLLLGEESAFHLGVKVEQVKLLVVALASLLTAAAVSVSGLIGFVGMMVPHLVRSVVGPDHRLVVPAAALGGATFLLLADTVARTVVPDQEIPVGVITAMLGAPFFCVLLRRRKALR